jgi:capsular polysaccharide biosynthesis protein
MSELDSGFRLGDVVGMIRRRWAVVAGAAALGALAGYLVFAASPKTYSATARVEVKPVTLSQIENPSRNGPTVDIATEKDLVKSDAVAAAIRKALGSSADNRSILTHLFVTTEDQSLVLKLTYTASTAEEARDGANAAGDAYLADRSAKAIAARNTAAQRLADRIADANARLDEATTALNRAVPDSAEYAAARKAQQDAQFEVTDLKGQLQQYQQYDPAPGQKDSVGESVRRAILPGSVLSKKALGKGVGTFGLFVLAGLGAAWFLDRRDGLGGGRRRIEQLVPGANIRILPGSDGTHASAAEIDTAIDRLAVELVAGSAPGRAASVLVVGAGNEPPVALAEELASSLAFAGIPALFVLAGTTDRQLRHCHRVDSFADLLTRASVAGPAGLPAQAGEPGPPVATASVITWLRPQGSAESSGLLRRAVVEGLVTKAARERFEAVVFVAASPTRTAAGTALGQWTGRTALVVEPEDRANAETVATALSEAGVRVTEVVWT